MFSEICTHDFFPSVLTGVSELVAGILQVTDPASQRQLANSARLLASSSLKMVEKSQTSLATGAVIEELAAAYSEAKSAVQKLLTFPRHFPPPSERIAELKS